jgi:5'-nucleotidase (lipoprotein e(P4) family)
MKYILFISSMIFLLSCKSKQETTNGHIRNTMATIYVQQSPEYIALAEQAFAQARFSLDNQFKTATSPLAVVLDIDETVLDNSPYQAKQILENFNFPDHWDEWVKKEAARPIPGSLAFLQHADSRGIVIFYISNRKQHLIEATINNLTKYGYPQVDTNHIMLRTSTSSKEERRQKVLDQGLEIAVLIGDNLDDMSAEFEVDDPSKRNEAVFANQSKFGTKYIVLPNPTYGKWVQNRGFYNAKLNQDSLARVNLKGF